MVGGPESNSTSGGRTLPYLARGGGYAKATCRKLHWTAHTHTHTHTRGQRVYK